MIEDANSDISGKTRVYKALYCHEYIGEGTSGYESLLLPIKEMRENAKKY